jgi:hypothetical protein
VVQGIIVGQSWHLSPHLFISAEVKAMQTTVNGWSITLKCDQLSNGVLLWTACAKDILAAVHLHPVCHQPAWLNTGVA